MGARLPRSRTLLGASTLALVALAWLATPATPLTAQAGFVRTTFASGLRQPTAFAFAPDGRLFVAEQGGRLRVIRDGVLLPAPFVTVPADSSGERGLLGVAFHPQFLTNRHVYVYYTTRLAPVHNRVVRFTAAGDVAAAGSETSVLELEQLSGATNHNGGALHFGPDGKLYVAVGENATSSHAQTLTNRLGKLLRVNDDGSIPSDNPFVAGASGENRAIWALGLRNPYTFAFQPVSGRLLVNDVGQNTWEEINEGRAGANYGWPDTEGPTSDPRFDAPIFAYGHGAGPSTGCAISGGAFYDPAVVQFPLALLGSYFFADFCSDWVRRLTPADAVAPFASGLENPVDLRVGPDGSLYVLARGSGRVYRIRVAGWPDVADADRDGLPDALEGPEGRNPLVRDNDVVNHPRLFVLQQYRDLLRREGETAGVQAWVQALSAGAPRAALVVSFLESPEFRQLLEPLTHLHRAAQGERPDEVSLRHWQERRRTDAGPEHVAAGLAASASFRQRYGSLSDAAFVTALYQDVLGRPADVAGAQHWRERLAAGVTRAQVLHAFATSPEFLARDAEGAFVAQLYASLLRRRADAAGYAFWVDRLEAGLPPEVVAGAFLQSAEYRRRFTP